MVNKKGVIRIIEASLAILIVLGAILIVSIDSRASIETDLSDIIPDILEEIAKNVTLREKIFIDETGAISEIDAILNKKITNPFFGKKAIICENINEICSLESYPNDAEGNIYSGERVISTTLNASEFKPKKLKIYLWRIKS